MKETNYLFVHKYIQGKINVTGLEEPGHISTRPARQTFLDNFFNKYFTLHIKVIVPLK